MTGLIVASLGFLALHLLPSLPIRATVIARIGLRPWLGAFSLSAGLLLFWMAIAYGNESPGEALWYLDTGGRLAVTILMLPAFVLVVMGVMTPNPAAVMAGGLLKDSTAPSGITTITRHPLNSGIALWAVLHIVARPEAPALVFFGSLLATAVLGSLAQDRRKAAELGAGWAEWRANTSALPFAAIPAGRARLAFTRADAIRAAVAIVLWAAAYHLHGTVIGTPVGL